jgi:gamma-glutamyltranspeptidase
MASKEIPELRCIILERLDTKCKDIYHLIYNVLVFDLVGGVLDISDFIMRYKVKTGNALEVYLENSTIYTMNGATGGPIVGLIMNILKRK